MRSLKLQPKATQQIADWLNNDPKTLKRIFRIFQECCRTPFEGIGKPEPLKGNLKGKWSRRIDDENRLVYEITDSEITVFSLFGHYE
jgi:toxin YoeB